MEFGFLNNKYGVAVVSSGSWKGEKRFWYVKGDKFFCSFKETDITDAVWETIDTKLFVLELLNIDNQILWTYSMLWGELECDILGNLINIPWVYNGITANELIKALQKALIKHLNRKTVSEGNWGLVDGIGADGHSFLWFHRGKYIEFLKVNYSIDKDSFIKHTRYRSKQGQNAHWETQRDIEFSGICDEYGVHKCKPGIKRLLMQTLSTTLEEERTVGREYDVRIEKEYYSCDLCNVMLKALLYPNNKAIERLNISLTDLGQRSLQTFIDAPKGINSYPVCNYTVRNQGKDYIVVSFLFASTFSQKDIVEWTKENRQRIKDFVFEAVMNRNKKFDAKYWEIGSIVALSRVSQLVVTLQIKQKIADIITRELHEQEERKEANEEKKYCTDIMHNRAKTTATKNKQKV